MKFEIRPAVETDIHEIARIHVLGWRAAYRGILPDSVLDSLDVAQRAERWAEWLGGTGVHTVLAASPAGVLGFVRLMPARPIAAPPAGAAEVTHLYVHPGKQSAGIGQALL
ncbi:MAG: GNAT family N-acetyltransferase, partial [Gammaproteobacteria bacterium]|nr:GNAT family N-acetyltransferase [Gammaproteobacteria bacterium]